MNASSLNRHVLALMFAFAVGNSWSFESAGLQSLSSFKEAKTWHEQFMQGAPTKAQRLEAMRTLVTSSPVGARGLRQIYQNFEGRYSIDPTIPGLEKSVLMQRSASKQQAKGYRREVLYAVAYHNDPRFSVVEMNRPLKRPWGNTDADLVIQHHPTGLYGRIEVKDYSLNSQRTNLQKLKAQIDKMSLEGKKTGQLQLWMNARPVIPEIYKFAESRGVYVSENVKTGKAIAPGSISALDAMNQHAQQFVRVSRQRVALGAGELSFGAWRLKNSLPEWIDDICDVDNPATRSTSSLLRLGESSSSVLAGSSMLVSSGALNSARFASEAMQSRLYSLGRFSGLTSLAALGVSEAFLVSRYVRGDVMSQEFWTGQWIMGTSTIGGIAGGFGGNAIGVLTQTEFLAPLYTAAGTATGTFLGSEVGTRTAQMYYEHKFGEIDRAYGKWVYDRYAIK